MAAEGVQYRITGPEAQVQAPPAQDAVAAALAFFHHDRPANPCAADVSTDGGRSWQATSPGAIARGASRELFNRAGQGDKTADVWDVLSDRQGEWLWQRKTSAAEQGMSPNAASQQAIREWVLQIGGVPPMSAITAFSQRAWSAGEKPGDMGWARDSADNVTWALRGVGRTLNPTVDGGTGPISSGQFRAHWLALASCGPAHPQAVAGARWHLDQAVRTDPGLYEPVCRMTSVGVAEEQALFLASIALTLQVSGYPKEAEQFLQVAVSNPAGLAAWVSSPEQDSVVQFAQQHLASLAGRVAHGGPYGPDIQRASRTQIAYAATQLTVGAFPPTSMKTTPAAAIAAVARNLTAAIARRGAKPTPPPSPVHDQQQVVHQPQPGNARSGR
ncbi:hypothetical protein ACFVYG_20670 [Streptomyces sp. NPDC058256]|uniref:hypothetical protein n=1 Tax=Streptomyces sp. NPDC058256 TaxID=3346408 RepID=UPI0036EE895F